MASNWSIVVSTIYNDYFRYDMTEAEAAECLRGVAKNFINLDLGCTKSIIREFNEIYVQRNGHIIVQFSGGEFFAARIGNKSRRAIFDEMLDWSAIFTMKPSELWKVTATGMKELAIHAA